MLPSESGQPLGSTDVIVNTGNEFTVIVPLAMIVPQPPVKVMVYGYVPATVAVPLIVTVLELKTPETPVGNPVKVAPVAPVVA